MIIRRFAVLGLWIALLAGCTTERRTRYPTTQPAGSMPPVAAPAATAPAPASGQASAAPAAGAAQPPMFDPINNLDVVWLRNRTQEILVELVGALDAGPRQRVTSIPLLVDDTVGEVNAFASCVGSRAAMAVTDGLLDIIAHLAQARATDETFGTAKTDAYIQLIARTQRPGQPIVRPALGFFEASQHLDSRKVSRQHDLLDEAIAFVLAHELAHHYLGHLPCTASGGALTASEINAVLSSAIPAFNQPNEVAADVAAINDVLNAGARRQGHRWTEGGGLLTMRFFQGLDQSSPIDVFDFERSHPPTSLRNPIIQQAAAAWRALGGRSIPIP